MRTALCATVLGVTMLTGSACPPLRRRPDISCTLTGGGNVVATGGGAIDLTELSLSSPPLTRYIVIVGTYLRGQQRPVNHR